MSLSLFNKLDQVAQNYKQSKSNLESIDTYISNKIETETKNERDTLNKAIKDYNSKVQSVLQSDDIKSQEEKIKKDTDIIKNSMKVAFECYKNVREIIYSKTDLSDSEKLEYEKKLYEKIMDKFMTQKEKDMFKHLMKNGNIIIMSGPINSNMNRIMF